jgi:hypothetical protein
MIKDECLGTFVIDRDREKIIKEFTKTINEFNKFTDVIFSDTNDKYKSVMQNITQYENFLYTQIGQICGHIEDYQSKINDLNLEEFTTSRIKQVTKLYSQMNKYFIEVNKSVS